jgi:hypothetical protein
MMKLGRVGVRAGEYLKLAVKDDRRKSAPAPGAPAQNWHL